MADFDDKQIVGIRPGSVAAAPPLPQAMTGSTTFETFENLLATCGGGASTQMMSKKMVAEKQRVEALKKARRQTYSRDFQMKPK